MNRAQRRAAVSRLNRPTSYMELTRRGYRVLHPTKGWRSVSAKRPGAKFVFAALTRALEARP